MCCCVFVLVYNCLDTQVGLNFYRQGADHRMGISDHKVA